MPSKTKPPPDLGRLLRAEKEKNTGLNQRIEKMRVIMKRLSEMRRRLLAEKAELNEMNRRLLAENAELCDQFEIQLDDLRDDLRNELKKAYEAINKQMDEVVLATEFRTLVSQELDAEDMLRVSLEYMLTQVGWTNVAVFLNKGIDSSGDSNTFGLGAYVNYDCPRETVRTILDLIGEAVCPNIDKSGSTLEFSNEEEFNAWSVAKVSFPRRPTIIVTPLIHADNILGVIVLFRSATEKFTPSQLSNLEIIRDLMANQLQQILKVHYRGNQDWPEEAKEGDLEYEEQEESRDLEDGSLGFGS